MMNLNEVLLGEYDAQELKRLQLVYQGLKWAKEEATATGKFDIGIDPIEEVPFPVPPQGYDTNGEISSWVLDALDIDEFIEKNGQRLIESPIRVVFIIHDTAGTYNENTGLDSFQVDEWNADNTGTGKPDDHNHSHNVATCIVGDKPGTRIGILRKLAQQGKVVLVADKVMSQGSGSFAWIRKGYSRTINLPYNENDMVIHVSSFGALGAKDAATTAAIKEGIEKGQVWLASSGNSGHDVTGKSRVGFPAADPQVIAVGAIDRDGKRKSYSSTGPEVYSTAGSGVPCVNRDGSINNREGTSFSQPINAALVGLMALYLGRKVTQDEAKELIRTRSIDLGAQGRDTFFGFGFQTSSTIKAPGDDPGDIDPKPPIVPERKPYALTVKLDHYVERWRTIAENNNGDPLRTINFSEIILEVKTTKPAAETVDILSKIVSNWSNKHYLAVPNDWTEIQVAAVAFRFLDMHLDREYGMTIDPVSVLVSYEHFDFEKGYYLSGSELGRWKNSPEDELRNAGVNMNLSEIIV